MWNKFTFGTSDTKRDIDQSKIKQFDWFMFCSWNKNDWHSELILTLILFLCYFCRLLCDRTRNARCKFVTSESIKARKQWMNAIANTKMKPQRNDSIDGSRSSSDLCLLLCVVRSLRTWISQFRIEFFLLKFDDWFGRQRQHYSWHSRFVSLLCVFVFSWITSIRSRVVNSVAKITWNDNNTAIKRNLKIEMKTEPKWRWMCEWQSTEKMKLNKQSFDQVKR